MKSWNLSSFDDLTPNVLSFVDKESTVELPSSRKRRPMAGTTRTAGILGTTVLLAALSLITVQVNVAGSDDELRLPTVTSIANVQTDRPPLTLLFGSRDPLRWTSAKESEMLEKAAASLSMPPKDDNKYNLIQAVLREELPSSREEALDLELLGKT